MDVDDHTQRAIEPVVLLRGEVVHLLKGQGFVAGQQGVPVALELGDAPGSSLDLLRRLLAGDTVSCRPASFSRSSSRVMSSSAAIS
jgi:hypothetical protein